MTLEDAPIGIFDSGIGGLTVAKEIFRQLPDERVIYFGDTARVPYGAKSPETVRRYSREIATFLIDQGVKCIVVACNTATAHALGALRESLAMPVIGVVGPGRGRHWRRREHGACWRHRDGRDDHVGRVRTGDPRPRSKRDPDDAAPCPLFVPLVEEGWTRPRGDAARC